jgi:hypothetical protein
MMLPTLLVVQASNEVEYTNMGNAVFSKHFLDQHIKSDNNSQIK